MIAPQVQEQFAYGISAGMLVPPFFIAGLIEFASIQIIAWATVNIADQLRSIEELSRIRATERVTDQTRATAAAVQEKARHLDVSCKKLSQSNRAVMRWLYQLETRGIKSTPTGGWATSLK